MTPKQKAFELFKKYSISVEIYFKEDSIPRIVNAPMRVKSAKKCVLIAVNEILIELSNVEFNYDLNFNDGLMQYWQQVKQEIKKL